jgi:hypothetical protein
VDAPRLDRDVDLGERPIPRIDVQIVRVDEGAVHVEEHSWGHPRGVPVPG